MLNLIKTIATAGVLAGLCAGSALGANLSPEGRWQSSDGQTRVNVALCGDGTQLCAQLVWLAEDARTPENLALLNANVVNGARALDENSWKGTVRFNGDSATGTIELVGRNTINVSGCKFGMCRSFKFNRI
jgi:uncharacterized protein (DUF2147 family)